MIGPVFSRELVTTPRRPRHYIYRVVFVTTLLMLMCTGWLVMAGTQIIRNVGDMARFGSTLFQVLAPLQLSLLTFLGALGSASAVAQEKDRRTLILLLLTRLTNSELVLGKMLASLLDVLTMALAAIPLLLLVTLFGGVDDGQVWRTVAITLITVLTAGSLGSTIALWREKTFQTLAMTALGIVAWLALGEVVQSGWLFQNLAGWSHATWAVALSPLRAILAATQPLLGGEAPASAWGETLADPIAGVWLYLACTGLLLITLNLIAILRVRVWNPSREVMVGQKLTEEEPETTTSSAADPEHARLGHVDARVRTERATSRAVWDNPVLWREMRTWAYGRKVHFIRLAYVLLFLLAAGSLYATMQATSNGSPAALSSNSSVIPAAARSLVPFFLVSLVIMNALAVTSITNERDGQALDLLLVTDLSPKEFVLGKLGGVLYVTLLMSVLPLSLATYLWWVGGVSLQNYVYIVGGLLTMFIFVTTLGIHCGMVYANSRTAIGVSLGTVFFLFLGITTCLVMMVSFSGSFQTQLWQFLMFILGGSLGLYVALGSRNPSSAIALAALLLPFLTFYGITTFALKHYLSVFLVMSSVYAFTTAAMLVPAISRFDIAMGRTKTPGEE
jgi:ABC-type transport system involved in multi-copper enzyme maturation permease subunit